MANRSRREFLGLCGVTLAVAGCIDDDPEFLVTNTQIIAQEGIPNVDYEFPPDLLVRVTIENDVPRRQEGTVVVTLEYTDGDTVVDSWETRHDISVGRGATPREQYVFKGVLESGREVEGFRANAYIEQAE